MEINKKNKNTIKKLIMIKMSFFKLTKANHKIIYYQMI